jgi:hypothetical protein
MIDAEEQLLSSSANVVQYGGQDRIEEVSARIVTSLGYSIEQMQVINDDQVVTLQRVLHQLKESLFNARPLPFEQYIHELPDSDEGSSRGAIRLPKNRGSSETCVTPKRNNRTRRDGGQKVFEGLFLSG